MLPLHDAWVRSGDGAGSDAHIPLAQASLRAVLLRRGVVDAESYRRFVSPTLDDLHDPVTIHGIEPACDRIERAIRDREPILIYGDYDVDGVTSIVLLRTVIRALGGNVDHVVPHRLIDGYGLKTEVIDRVLAERNVRLVVTVDCGISSVEPVEHAIERGIDVIITDHHLPPGTLPDAAAVLNPKQDGCTYPFKDLAGVGVAFKLCCRLLTRAGHRMSVGSLLKIAAIGTIADVAPLIGENRTIAQLGLAGLADPRNPGLRALFRSLKLYGRPLSSFDIGFRIGPRINAAGRLASADTAIRLFSVRSEEEARPLIAELEHLNGERRRLERALLEEAEEQIAEQADSRVIVVASPNWHRGVVGLCAGRIAQTHHRPALVLSIDGDLAVGSGRSVPAVNLHSQLEKMRDLFDHFGGHDFACGFSLPSARVPELRRRAGEIFGALPDDCFVRSIEVDATLPLEEIDREWLDAHALLEPFGQSNRQPVFHAAGVGISALREFAPECHALSVKQDGATRSGVLWPARRELLDACRGNGVYDVLFHIEGDRWSADGLRLELLDAAPSGTVPVRNEKPIPAVE
ncbi:MAG: single-stranded-DNA-specific exonuclease RecJ [Thermoanaerobaculia bacterium]